MNESVACREMDFSVLIGAWEVVECGLETSRGDGHGVVGAIFELTDEGEVLWKLPENRIDIPVFSSETFEVVARGPFLTTLIRFGSYKGHLIEFRIEKFNTENKTMTIHEGLLYMNCRKLTGDLLHNSLMELPFTLLPAYKEGYFTDLIITASDNTKFAVHTCILKILTPTVNWRTTPNPLSGLSRRIISSVLYFMYTFSLPQDLTLEAAEELIVTSSNIPGLEDLTQSCKTFIKNVKLARDMASLVCDVHSLGIQATDHFAITSELHSIKEPPILCSAVRNAMRDIAVAISKIMLFCDTYNKRKKEFCQKGAHEIIRFTKSRIPFFVSQVTAFMQVVKSTFGNLTGAERHELASYLIPDMAYIFDTLITLLLRTQEFFETVLLRLGPEDTAKYRLKMHNFKEHMERINHKKELNKIRFVLHRIECLIHHLRKKKDRFRNLNSDNKIRSLARNIDHLIDRLPFFFMRVEEMTEDLEQKSEWIENQFCFKMTTAKVGEFLNILLENKEDLQTLISSICDVVQRDDFTQAIISLGILDYPIADDFINLSLGTSDDISAEEHGFNLSNFLFEPPPPRLNALCRNSLQRLIDGVETDMVFRIIPSNAANEFDDYGNIMSDFTDDDTDFVYGLGQPIVCVDAKVEDASTAPAGAEDASSTDRGSDSEATASTGTESACPNNTDAEGACSSLAANSATPAGTRRGGGVAPGKHTDGATHAKKGKEDDISTRKQTDGARRGGSRAEDDFAVAGPSTVVRPRKYEEGLSSKDVSKLGWRTPVYQYHPHGVGCVVHGRRFGEGSSSEEEIGGGVRRRARKMQPEIPRLGIECSFSPETYEDEGSTSEEEMGGVRRRTRKQGFQAPAAGAGCVVHGRRYGERGSSDEDMGGVRRRTRRPEYQNPPHGLGCVGHGRRFGERSSSDEELGGVRRRIRRPEYQIPAARTASAARPKRDREYASSFGRQIGGARRRFSEAEDNIFAVRTGSVARQKQGKIGAAFARGGLGEGACAITGGAGFVGRGEKEEEAGAWAIRKGFSRIERNKGGAPCTSTASGPSSIERDAEEGRVESAYMIRDYERILRGKSGEKGEIITVKAHRAILATRCPFFKRAFRSGMQEDINRTIDIHNISPRLFPLFLNYLYTGIIDYASLTPLQLTEMFLTADFYELYSLKEGCERALMKYIDVDSVLFFLHLADEYMAPIMKDFSRKYIKENPTVSLDSELYRELPKKLKSEIYDLIAWGKDRVLLVSFPDQDESDGAGACALADADSDTGTAQVSRTYDWTSRMCWSKAVSIGRRGVRDLNIVAPQPMQYQPNIYLESLSGDRELIMWVNLPRWNIPRVDIEDCIPSADTIRFRWGIEQLRDIVGAAVPRSTLVQVLLAADCDLNRALNYYYSAS